MLNVYLENTRIKTAEISAYSTVAAHANSIAVLFKGTGALFAKFAIVQLIPTP